MQEPATADVHAATAGTRAAVHTVVDSPLGRLRLVVDDAGALAGVHLSGHSPPPRPADPGPRVPPDDPAVAPAVAAVLDYLHGRAPAVLAALAEPVGATAFQRAVWDAVARVPRGATATYGEVAAAAGRPGAFRATGAAVARNPVCLAVPCHRVVGTGGGLVGWAGGAERERWLLALDADEPLPELPPEAVAGEPPELRPPALRRRATTPRRPRGPREPREPEEPAPGAPPSAP